MCNECLNKELDTNSDINHEDSDSEDDILLISDICVKYFKPKVGEVVIMEMEHNSTYLCTVDDSISAIRECYKNDKSCESIVNDVIQNLKLKERTVVIMIYENSVDFEYIDIVKCNCN